MDNYTQHHHAESPGEKTNKLKKTNKQPNNLTNKTNSLHNYQMCLLLFKTELLKPTDKEFSWDPT